MNPLAPRYSATSIMTRIRSGKGFGNSYLSTYTVPTTGRRPSLVDFLLMGFDVGSHFGFHGLDKHLARSLAQHFIQGRAFLSINDLGVDCCNPMKMSPCAHNRNVPSRSDSWLAPSPSRLMMASARDPSRVRKAKPYGLALDCSLADAKRALGSTRRMGLRA